jgi:hypothetical protein
MRALWPWAVAATLAASVSHTAPALAVDENIYQAIAGPWLFASERTEGSCVVTLSSTIEAGHHAVRDAPLCSGVVGAIADARIWELDASGGLTFRGSNGRALISLVEDPDGQYYQAGEAKGERLVLMAANEGSERLVSPSEMAGRWEFRRPDGAGVCGVAFSTALLPKSTSFRALQFAPECDPGLKKLKLVKWHIEGALLVLVGAETADLTLVPKADGTFVKSAKEGGKPLVLTRR